MVSMIHDGRTARTAIVVAFLASLVATPAHADAAAGKQGPGSASLARGRVLDDIAAVAAFRPKKCSNAPPDDWKISGWRAQEPLCAWQNHLQMRRWEVQADATPSRCLSKQALWWASVPISGTTMVKQVWNRAWTAQSLIDELHGQQRVVTIQHTKSGNWIATEWRWTPSPREATRQWQARRWKLLTDAARAIEQSTPASPDTREAMALALAWQKNLNRRPGEIVNDFWLWEHDRLCLRMEVAAASKSPLHLPYAKEEWRLEQRSAMQVLLARTYPNAKWLTPFKLLALPGAQATSGAKYAAIWRDSGVVTGQLWMPVKGNGGILRGKISVALPPKKDDEADAATTAFIAASIDRELIGVATAMVAGE